MFPRRLNPIAQSTLLHLTVVIAGVALFYKPKMEKKSVRFEVYENIKVVPKTLNLEPPKPEAVKPPPTPVETRQVFGVTRKSLTTTQADPATAEIKTGNTIAKEMDDLKLNPDDADSLPIPADEFLVTSMPVLISEVRISYPDEAKKAGIEGPVVMDLLIDEQGVVRQVALLKGPGFGLNEAALTAIKNFQFRPAKIKDQSVAVKIRYTYRFILENR